MAGPSGWRFNFFDLGAWPGNETQAFLDAADSFRDGRYAPVVAAYLWEAHPDHARQLIDRFSADPRVFVFNCAIGSANGVADLFEAAKPEGTSIYPDKAELSGSSVSVKECVFSEMLRSLGLDRRGERTANIIKANIEGAEWDLIQDLNKSGLWRLFDLYLGADQWTADMGKCHSLLPFIAKARTILDSAGISVNPFCLGGPNYPPDANSVDLRMEIQRIMEERNCQSLAS